MIDHTTFWLKATFIFITFCPAVLMGGSGFPVSTSFTRSRLVLSSLSASAGDDDDDDDDDDGDGEVEK